MSLKLTYYAPQHAKDARFFFRYEQANAKTEYLPHSHAWGQLIFVKCNVLQIHVEGERLLTPADFPVWVPPGKEHASYNNRQANFRTFNIAAVLCGGLPEKACLLNVGPIVNAIIDDCASRQLLVPDTDEDRRLCDVLLDQLRNAEVQESYLPMSQDKYLAPILQALEHNPADNTTLAQWAQRVYTTERTLSRRCQAQLGMSFSEWRQRLRFLHAISRLEQGMTVQNVALDLGYSSASSLIVMFQQQAGTTPDRYRTRPR
ncbi:AraC family transcriptional regulator [[Pantoea] beijingensis]|uniref:AraC family transcriptional regulator n=1 Tax=[Pantoea] beijingensis TaxID=1324864 RepID=A0A443I9G0_9GAMM|nr:MULTISPECIES: helix-turn-helix transcriptional regulator [Erwiniaceae]RWR00742.1 AraC family transcriptional regulator [[Pantoea] beijingensis]